MEGRILGYRRTAPVGNNTLRSLIGIADVEDKIAWLKWDLTKHVSRMLSNRWVKISTLLTDGDLRVGREGTGRTILMFGDLGGGTLLRTGTSGRI